MYVKHFFDVFVGGIEVERNQSSALMDVDLPTVMVPLEDLRMLMPGTGSVTPVTTVIGCSGHSDIDQPSSSAIGRFDWGAAQVHDHVGAQIHNQAALQIHDQAAFQVNDQADFPFNDQGAFQVHDDAVDQVHNEAVDQDHDDAGVQDQNPKFKMYSDSGTNHSFHVIGNLICLIFLD
jgi:hypothetical protein